MGTLEAIRLRTLVRVFACLVCLAGVSLSAHGSARVTNGDLPPGVITAIRLHDSGSGAGRGVSFGLPLPEGRIRGNTGLVVTTPDGEVLDSQWNPLASWRTDGSVLHGVLTFVTNRSGSNEGIYYVREGTPVSGSVIDAGDIVDSGFDAEVSAVIDGVTYSLSASDLLDGAVSPRLNYMHFSGPLATEIAIGGPLRVGGTGAEHNTVQAYFYIRAFGKPVRSVYVTVVLENTAAFRQLRDVSASNVDVKVGGRSLPGFPKSSFTIYSDIRYPKRAYWNGGEELWVQHDLAYVSETKLMPKYRSVVMNTSVLNSYPQSSEWNQRRILSSSNLEGGGAKPELAPHDHWTAAYMVSGDRRAWNAMRTAVDEYSQMVYEHVEALVRPRDEETGMPLDLTKKGVASRSWYPEGGTDVLVATRGGVPVAQTDNAHWPSIGYLLYLLTAESNEMENVQHSAVQMWLNSAPGGYKGRIPNRQIRWGQARAMGWALREIVNGAVVTPDHHPLRNALQVSASHALTEVMRVAKNADPQGATGLWLAGDLAFPYGDRTGLAPWMNDFLTWAVGDAYERGWQSELDAGNYWQWRAQAVVGRFGTSIATGYCWQYAALYELRVKPSSSSSPYPTWKDIFAANFPNVSSCSSTPGSGGIGTDRSATDYGAQIAGALAVAVSTNIPNAAQAWELYDKRQKNWGTQYSSAPEWAIEPRNVNNVRPMAPTGLVVD